MRPDTYATEENEDRRRNCIMTVVDCVVKTVMFIAGVIAVFVCITA